jgi:hypothetical protein
MDRSSRANVQMSAATNDDHVAGLLAAVVQRGLKSVSETHFDPAETDMNYCGIDLHSNNCVVIVSDDNDRIVYQKRLPNELAQVAAALESYRHELAGVVVDQPRGQPGAGAAD